MTSAEEFLGPLTGELEPVRELVRRYAGADTRSDKVTGSLSMVRRDELGPEAYALTVFPGVVAEVISRYEEIHGISICTPYRAILTRMNGAFLFGVDFFGLPLPMTKRPPLLDRSNTWPLDLASAQKHWKSEYDVSSDLIYVGSAAYSFDENMGYFMSPDGLVQATRCNGEIVGHWPSFRECLAQELARAEGAFLKSETIN